VHNASKEYGQPYTPKQQELINEGEEIYKRGEINRTDAEDYVVRSRNAGFDSNKVRIDEGHMRRTNSAEPIPGVSGKPHLHTPKKNRHIPITDNQ